MAREIVGDFIVICCDECGETEEFDAHQSMEELDEEMEEAGWYFGGVEKQKFKGHTSGAYYEEYQKHLCRDCQL